MIFVGSVEKSILRVDFPANFERFLMTLEGKRVTVEVKQFRKNRTDQQNKYWWGVVIDLLSRHCGYEPEEMHDAIKYKFLSLEKFGLKSGRSTARLTTQEFNELIEQVQRWAAQELGVYIPDPEEA